MIFPGLGIATVHYFLIRYWCSNLGPHTFETTALQTELSPQSPKNILGLCSKGTCSDKGGSSAKRFEESFGVLIITCLPTLKPFCISLTNGYRGSSLKNWLPQTQFTEWKCSLKRPDTNRTWCVAVIPQLLAFYIPDSGFTKKLPYTLFNNWRGRKKKELIQSPW